MTWKNLAPDLVRQRVIIEGTSSHLITRDEIASYLTKLSKVLEMHVLQDPFVYKAENLGYGAWIHWITSGAHFYSYSTTPPFFSVDAYTCKPFDAKKAAEFTRDYFNADEIVFKEVEI